MIRLSGVRASGSKYRNRRTNGFASKRESDVFDKLWMLEQGGKIAGLATQVLYRLEVNGDLICKYVADFVYRDERNQLVIADAKGYRTREYLLKKKLMKAIHGIEIKEL